MLKLGGERLRRTISCRCSRAFDFMKWPFQNEIVKRNALKSKLDLIKYSFTPIYKPMAVFLLPDNILHFS